MDVKLNLFILLEWGGGVCIYLGLVFKMLWNFTYVCDPNIPEKDKSMKFNLIFRLKYLI